MSSTCAQPPAPDPARCPLCGGPNGCALAACPAPAEALACWCTRAHFPPELLARVPPPARHQACICAHCAGAAASAAEASPASTSP